MSEYSQDCPSQDDQRGYWLLDTLYPPLLDAYCEVFVTDSEYMFVALLHWLANQLTDRLALASRGVSLHVIIADYTGPYPCLAARVMDGDLTSLPESEFKGAIDDLLMSAPFCDFMRHICDVRSRQEIVSLAEGLRGVGRDHL
jgi:hypothetical protein